MRLVVPILAGGHGRSAGMMAIVSRSGRFHLDLLPTRLQIGDRLVTFVGAMFHSKSVMIEYDVEPPIRRDSPFGPTLLVLTVTDDTSAEVYPTAWEDFDWGFQQSGRMTTRLDRRPPPEATKLLISVHEPNVIGPNQAIAGHQVGQFVIELPSGHAINHADAG